MTGVVYVLVMLMIAAIVNNNESFMFATRERRYHTTQVGSL